ncbi:MAG: thioredoxin domain-containing protein [Lentisphaeria bacterium]|nr:thioredoxin domain-containing protein [Lentisphaeria bacterium]
MRANRLIHEKSPYLLQHARNPVDWYPWGEEAFARARRENKPIFLSVGYSTCHWCHVMARESFESAAVAKVLNQHFVPVKVDREERPDVDKVYMTYVQATTGGGGWPMSVWLTPDLKPFFGGTYFPPEDKWGQPGFITVLKRVADAWSDDRDRIIAAADGAIDHLRQATNVAPDPAVELERELLDQAYRQITSSYDARYGGFGGAPKFPRPSVPDFLLRYHARTGTRDALDMTLHTLRQMAGGGIHDHLGGGFHRYSVDERWHVPHFEKMLYDQAQLACTYLDAYQITHEPFYAGVARDILDYVQRDMTGEHGQFYSAEDADSGIPGNPDEHAEGAFYVWEAAEIAAILGDRLADIFSFHYGIGQNGNVRDDPHGEFQRKNILHTARAVAETAARFGKDADDADDAARLLAAARGKLLARRDERPRPHLDDKTITAWNGLMISAFARACQVLDDQRYLETARTAAGFIRDRLYDEPLGVLLRRYRRGEAAIDGYLDDYAFLIQGLLDLYEASFEINHLTWAITLQKKQTELFQDKRAGGYFSTTGGDKTVLLRMKDDYDGAEPAANSVAALNLLRLARMTDTVTFQGQAERTLQAFARQLTRAPHAMPRMMAAFDYHLDTPKQIIIAGDPEAADTQRLLREVHARFIPNKILMLADGGNGQNELARHFAFIESIHCIDGKATAYVCENNVCKLPTTDPDQLAERLEARQ